jgi:hypothetical protein
VGPEYIESYNQADRIMWVGRGQLVDPTDYMTYIAWRDPIRGNYQSGGFQHEVRVGQHQLLEHLGALDLLQNSGVVDVNRTTDYKDYDKVEHHRRVLEFFMELSNITGKEFEFCDTYKDWYGDRAFLFRTLPNMTLEQRIRQMQLLVPEIVDVLKSDHHALEVWLGGSLARENPSAWDIDLLISSRPFDSGEFLSSQSGLANFQAHADCKYGGGSLRQLVDGSTVQKIGVISEDAGIKIDCNLVPENKFNNPTCCDWHQHLIKSLKLRRC